MSQKDGLRLPLFIKKHNGEGDDHYYMGEMTPVAGSVINSEALDKKGTMQPVAKMRFMMNHPVEENMYNYLTAPQAVVQTTEAVFAS